MQFQERHSVKNKKGPREQKLTQNIIATASHQAISAPEITGFAMVAFL